MSAGGVILMMAARPCREGVFGGGAGSADLSAACVGAIIGEVPTGQGVVTGTGCLCGAVYGMSSAPSRVTSPRSIPATQSCKMRLNSCEESGMGVSGGSYGGFCEE